MSIARTNSKFLSLDDDVKTSRITQGQELAVAEPENAKAATGLPS
jgi:hypothetical protein